MVEPMIKEFLAQAGSKGGQSRSDRKKLASRANANRAREAKLLYRLDPGLRPPKEIKDGNPR